VEYKKNTSLRIKAARLGSAVIESRRSTIINEHPEPHRRVGVNKSLFRRKFEFLKKYFSVKNKINRTKMKLKEGNLQSKKGS